MGKVKPKNKPDLAVINARLKVDFVPVRIEQRGSKLCLVATLPPKPGSTKTKWHQQRISVGLPANPAGVRRAERFARLIGIQLAEGKFDWAEWGKAPADTEAPQTAGAIIEAFRQSLNMPDVRWRERYMYFGLNRIPPDQPLTAEQIIAAALTKEPDSRARQVACERLGRFAKFAGIEVDLSPFEGNYSRADVVPRDLPSDEEIEKLLNSIPNRQWRNVFWVMAIFGCRDHEVFNSRLEPLGQTMALNVLKGKTGPRFPVMPMPGDWLEYVDLSNLPQINVVEHTRMGQRCASAWRRQLGDISFTPYALRHCYAIRCHIKGIPIALAAKWMGHSQHEHTKTYQRWINEQTHLEVWQRAQSS